MTTITDTYARKILKANGSRNFIYAGDLVNEARKGNITLRQLAVCTELSTSTLSNMSAVSERSTQEMRMWARDGKLSFKSLREIVRMPAVCRVYVAEKVRNGHLSSMGLGGLRKALQTGTLTEFTQTIDSACLLTNRGKSVRKDKSAKVGRSLFSTGIFMYKYSYAQIIEAMDEFGMKLSYFNSSSLALWEKKGLGFRVRILERHLDELKKNIKIDADGNVSKM